MSDIPDDVARVQTCLGRLILNQLTGAASLQYFPTPDADRDDELIAFRQKRVTELRRLRQEFEDLVTGVLPTHV